jgi:sugar lactone lactonase YvrE
MKTFRAEVASDESYGLGEGPLWDAVRERVLWVDINAGHVHSGFLRDGRVVPAEPLSFPGTVGAVVCAEDGELLVAGQRELWRVTPDGAKTPDVKLIPDEKASRLNDGACDPAGRFLVGSMALDDRVGEEILIRIEDSAVIDDDLTLSNGLAWTPDGDQMYSIDTEPGMIWIRDYDPATGFCGAREEFLRVMEGSPDGCCVDADGNLWLAVWSAGEVRCFSPSGDLLAIVEVAAPNTTSVAFAGPRLDTLLITTARSDGFPDSGKLFSCDVGVTGLPVPAWSRA